MKKTKTATVRSSTPVFWLQIITFAALLLATAAAAVMSARHVWAIAVPGCGPTGGCEWATNGPYSKLFGFPVAFLGLGYFVASLCNVALSRWSFPDRISIWLVRLGAIGSLVFLGLMLSHGKICLWCAFTHLGNLVFWGVAEQLARLGARGSMPDYRNISIAALVGLLAIAGLQLNKSRVATAKEAEDYRKGMESVAKIGTEEDNPTETTSTQSPVQTPPPPKKSADGAQSDPVRFGGRYWEGSPNPAVRIVIFHDYQCELCREVEAAIATLISRRSDVALSVKQWPFDAGCNRFILGKNMHPGACEASKVAEAAGLAGGNEAFWGIHHWLVERGGRYSQADLRTRLAQLDVDVDDFGRAFNDPAIDSLVRADIEEGMAFGLTYTPLVFVNGYRVDGWQSAGVLPAAIERAAELSKRQPRRNDRPDLALDIQFRNWLATPAVPLPLRSNELSRGPIDAGTTIVMYGDLTCVFHASAREILDGVIGQYPGVRYVFRDFPLDANCNRLVKQQINPRACELSKWAIAVRQLAGDDSYWKAHDWMVRNRGRLETVTLETLGLLVGLKPADILRAASSPEVEGVLQANLSLAIQMNVTMSPTIYVNAKNVAGWRTPGVLSRVLSAATSAGRQ